MTEVAASPATKARRLPILRAAVMRRKKSDAMREYWEQRRRELREFEDDDRSTDSESAGSPDAELAELPEVLG